MTTTGICGLVLIVSTALLFFTGLTIFTRGFLLTKASLDRSMTSSCVHNWTTDLPAHRRRSGELNVDYPNFGCWHSTKFKRAVVILIDGLRYDFIEQMPAVDELLSSDHRRARLCRFVADPPTTTMQRIKALITGGLPTFVEAGHNFATAEIGEDNIVDGLVNNGKKVVFMGDDTWMGMLPGRFHQAFPFSSFNVKDLHTVDSGVLEHLVPMLEEAAPDTWDVIVAHFLGVDHCGHTHGPSHPEMSKKLAQMDQVVRSVAELLDNDTVLFLFGDHGMTKTGDHGGDSALEVDSALFIFSRQRPLVADFSPRLTKEVSQIDFAATFSLLMGIPIPFGNLGTAIPELFSDRDDSAALYLNVKQVERFLQAYGAVSNDFAGKTFQIGQIETLLDEIDALWMDHRLKNASLLNSKCEQYLSKVQRLCRDTWAKFDLPLLVTGLVLMASAVLVSFKMATRHQLSMLLSFIAASSLFGLSLLGLALSLRPFYMSPDLFFVAWIDVLMATALAAVHVFLVTFPICAKPVLRKVTTIAKVPARTGDFFAVGACLTHATLNFSNSYVVCEDSGTSFLFLTLLITAALSPLGGCSKARSPGVSDKTKGRTVLQPQTIVCIGAAIVASICVRILPIFRKCREEQWPWCLQSDFLSPQLTSIESEEQRSHRLLLAFLAIVLIMVGTRLLLRRAGNLNGHSLTVLSATYFPIIMCLAICSYWALLALQTSTSHVALPNVVFGTAFLGLLVLLVRPLTIYEPPSLAEADKIDLGLARGSGLIVPQVFRHLRSNWQHLLSPTTKDKQRQKPLVVYGLATVFSSVLLIAVTYVVLVLVILSTDSYAAALMLLMVTVGAVAHCFAAFQHNADPHLDVPWCWVVLFSLLSSVGFYATGHQQTFPSLHWESAAVGSADVDPTLAFGGQVISALKILANTFASAIVVAICLPILIIWPAAYRTLFESSRTAGSSNQGEFELLDNPSFFDALLRLFSKYMAVQGVKLLGCMIAAALHRRHLMVWKIFAPRFVYEAVNFVVSVPAILFSHLLILSVNRALRRWVSDKEKRQMLHLASSIESNC